MVLLEERKGRSRHTFDEKLTIEKPYHFFKSKIAKGKQVFQIPYIFDVDGAGSKEIWATEPEQFIIDLRSEETKNTINHHLEVKNFKAEYNIWQERPRLIKSEISEQPK